MPQWITCSASSSTNYSHPPTHTVTISPHLSLASLSQGTPCHHCRKMHASVLLPSPPPLLPLPLPLPLPPPPISYRCHLSNDLTLRVSEALDRLEAVSPAHHTDIAYLPKQYYPCGSCLFYRVGVAWWALVVLDTSFHTLSLAPAGSSSAKSSLCR